MDSLIGNVEFPASSCRTARPVHIRVLPTDRFRSLTRSFSQLYDLRLPDSREGIVTAEEQVRREAMAIARATLHRFVGTVFAVVDSVAAGQATEAGESDDDEALELPI